MASKKYNGSKFKTLTDVPKDVCIAPTAAGKMCGKPNKNGAHACRTSGHKSKAGEIISRIKTDEAATKTKAAEDEKVEVARAQEAVEKAEDEKVEARSESFENAIAEAKKDLSEDATEFCQGINEIITNLIALEKVKLLRIWPDGHGYAHETLDGDTRRMGGDDFEKRLHYVQKGNLKSTIRVWSLRTERELISFLEEISPWHKARYEQRVWRGTLRRVIEDLIWGEIPSVFLIDWRDYRPKTDNELEKAKKAIKVLRIKQSSVASELSQADATSKEMEELAEIHETELEAERISFGLSKDELAEMLDAKEFRLKGERLKKAKEIRDKLASKKTSPEETERLTDELKVVEEE